MSTLVAIPMQSTAREDDAIKVDAVVYREVQRAVNRKIGFIGHAIVFAITLTLILYAADFAAAVIVGLSWGIGLACHGFFGVIAPKMRPRWTAEELERRFGASMTRERRQLEGRHSRSLEQLSASIAHEIRNPVTAARSLVAQMGEDPSSAENVEYARVALEELDRVERSISHLLRYARDEEIDIRETRIADVMDSALESFGDRIARTGVHLERHSDATDPVRADPEKLRRVIINLVANALDAMEQSKTPAPRLLVASGENLARTEAWVRVRDNGPGMRSEEITRIFSPFYTSKANGTGLGLAISKKLVEAHGGSLEANSTQGEGSEFVLTLPKRGPVPSEAG